MIGASGEVLKQLRKRAGLTQDELAEACNTTRSTIARYEAGQIQPKGPKAVALAEALGVSTDVILGANQKDPQPQKPEINEVVQLAEALSPESRKLATAYLQALHDAERASNRKP